MRAKLLLALACLSVAGAFTGAAATHEPCSGTITTILVGRETAYVEDRGAEDGRWFYAETNGIPRLQSGGFHVDGGVIFGNDPCMHANPDTLIY